MQFVLCKTDAFRKGMLQKNILIFNDIIENVGGILKNKIYGCTYAKAINLLLFHTLALPFRLVYSYSRMNDDIKVFKS